MINSTVHTKYLADLDLFELTQPIISREMTVPIGFQFDGITAPKWLRWLVPRINNALWAAVIHDYCYVHAIKTKRWADALFYRNLLKTGYSKRKAKMWLIGATLVGCGSY